MPQVCKEPGCTSFQFGGGYCKYHQFRRSMRGGDKYQAKSKQNRSVEPRSPSSRTKVPPESKKRKIERVLYSEQIKQFWDESVANKTDFCFFCGEHMKKRDNIHHWHGRTNDYLLDKRYWCNCHNQCHLDHHHKSIAWLMAQPYYPEFIARLKEFDIESFNKEMKRQEKSQDLFGD